MSIPAKNSVKATMKTPVVTGVKPQEDVIVYAIWTKGGGVDGMDHKDKPKKTAAFFDRALAVKACDAWSEIKLEIIEDVAERTRTIVRNLDPIDRLLLGL